jgi:hypothetical protein
MKTAAGWLALAVLLGAATFDAKPNSGHSITSAQKQEFLRLLATLPHGSEFYPRASVKKAAPYLPVLMALDEKDLENHDLYSLGALSRGLCDEKPYREYVVAHFKDIRHPYLQILWAAMLFDGKAASPEVKQFLNAALQSEQQSKVLQEIVGPQFEDFKKRVLATKQIPALAH